jgi:hypothetical protein
VSNMFYQVPRDPKRSPTFHVMFQTEFPSPKAVDITLTRQICVPAGQIFMSWLGTYTYKEAKQSQKEMARLGPWYGQTFSYTGTNMASPIRNNINHTTNDAVSLSAREQILWGRGSVTCSQQKACHVVR